MICVFNDIFASIHLAVQRNRDCVSVCVLLLFLQHSMREISSYRSTEAVKCSEEHQSFLYK